MALKAKFNNSLSLITKYFNISEIVNPVEIVDLIYKNIDKALYDKYASYYVSESTSEDEEYNDNVISLTFASRHFQGYKYIHLGYTYLPLYHQKKLPNPYNTLVEHLH